jgi:hypothetical protein
MLPSTTRENRYHKHAEPYKNTSGAVGDGKVGNHPPTRGQNRKVWAEAWIGGPIGRWNELEKPKVLRDY